MLRVEYVMRLILCHSDLKGSGRLAAIFSKTGVMLVYEPLEVLIVIDDAQHRTDR